MLIYVSHIFQNKIENKLDAENVIRKLVKENPEHTYIGGLHPFYFMYDEVDYETGINMCLEVLKRCDMMYVFGDWQNSRGCKEEIKFCEENGIPYKIISEQVASEKYLFDAMKNIEMNQKRSPKRTV